MTRAPRSLTAVRAATVPISALTALQAVGDHGRVWPGRADITDGAQRCDIIRGRRLGGTDQERRSPRGKAVIDVRPMSA